MNAPALAMPTPLPAAGLQSLAAPTQVAPVAGLALRAATCVEQTADLMRLACRRGQLEDASAAARTALPLAAPYSPHQALLRALGEAHPTLMVGPEERRLYLLRQADGRSLGVMRLRDNGRVGPTAPAAVARWTLRDGNLELCDAQGQARSRFMLCGERDGLRLYLGESLADGAPQLLQEVRCTYARLSLLDPELVDPFCSLYDVDAMVPADLPAGSTLLLGAPHSGADRLAEVLNRHGALFFDGELLHPQAIGLAEGLLSPSAHATLHAMRAKDATWFARMMLGRSFDATGRDLSAVPVRGFTLAPSHHHATLDWAIAEPALRIVHVVRSNLLAEFADILDGQGAQADGSALLHLEPERFGRFIKMKQRDIDGLRQRLVQRNADTVEVDGSRLNANTVAELTAFLTEAGDAETAESLAIASQAARGTQARVIDRFDNPETVLACLRTLSRIGWAEVEGTVADPA